MYAVDLTMGDEGGSAAASSSASSSSASPSSAAAAEDLVDLTDDSAAVVSDAPDGHMVFGWLGGTAPQHHEDCEDFLFGLYKKQLGTMRNERPVYRRVAACREELGEPCFLFYAVRKPHVPVIQPAVAPDRAEKMTVPILQAKLRIRGLAASGKKAILVERLAAFVPPPQPPPLKVNMDGGSWVTGTHADMESGDYSSWYVQSPAKTPDRIESVWWGNESEAHHEERIEQERDDHYDGYGGGYDESLCEREEYEMDMVVARVAEGSDMEESARRRQGEIAEAVAQARKDGGDLLVEYNGGASGVFKVDAGTAGTLVNGRATWKLEGKGTCIWWSGVVWVCGAINKEVAQLAAECAALVGSPKGMSRSRERNRNGAHWATPVEKTLWAFEANQFLQSGNCVAPGIGKYVRQPYDSLVRQPYSHFGGGTGPKVRRLVNFVAQARSKECDVILEPLSEGGNPHGYSHHAPATKAGTLFRRQNFPTITHRPVFRAVGSAGSFLYCSSEHGWCVSMEEDMREAKYAGLRDVSLGDMEPLSQVTHCGPVRPKGSGCGPAGAAAAFRVRRATDVDLKLAEAQIKLAAAQGTLAQAAPASIDLAGGVDGGGGGGGGGASASGSSAQPPSALSLIDSAQRATKRVKIERDEAVEDAQDEGQTYSLFIDRLQGKVDRLKALCGKHGIPEHEVRSALDG